MKTAKIEAIEIARKENRMLYVNKSQTLSNIPKVQYLSNILSTDFLVS